VEIIVKSKNCDVPDRVKEEADQRLRHATRFFDRVLGVEAVFAEQANRRIPEPATVELTARTKGHRIRAQASGADHRRALDAAAERFERQLERYKTRMTDRRRRSAPAPAALPNGSAPPARRDAEDEAPLGLRIVRSKRFEMVPMLPEDAAWHLELLGHDFYVFTNAATGACNVLYRRKDGDLGLIETRPALADAAAEPALA
jgi:putative sigma-54 modulation protein